MSAVRHAAHPQLASHMLEDNACAGEGLSSGSDGDPDDDSVDGMFHAAADAIAAAVAASPTALQQHDKLQLYGLYKQVGNLRVHKCACALANRQASNDSSQPYMAVLLIGHAALCCLH